MIFFQDNHHQPDETNTRHNGDQQCKPNLQKISPLKKKYLFYIQNKSFLAQFTVREKIKKGAYLVTFGTG